MLDAYFVYIVPSLTSQRFMPDREFFEVDSMQPCEFPTHWDIQQNFEEDLILNFTTFNFQNDVFQ